VALKRNWLTVFATNGEMQDKIHCSNGLEIAAASEKGLQFPASLITICVCALSGSFFMR